MKRQEPIKNDGNTIQADTLTDLPVTDEQANQTTAGSSGLFEEALCGKPKKAVIHL